MQELMNRFLLVRYGESIWNKDSKFTSQIDIALTNNGRAKSVVISNSL